MVQAVSFANALWSPSILRRCLLPDRANTWMVPTWSKAAWAQIAVAAPPIPRSVMVSPFIRTPCSLTDCIKPTPSVLCPIRRPFRFSTVFTAPMSRAAPESSSKYSKILFLFGMVRLNPFTCKARSPCTASFNPSPFTSKHKYTQSIPRFSKLKLCIRGEILWATGLPSNPVRHVFPVICNMINPPVLKHSFLSV